MWSRVPRSKVGFHILIYLEPLSKIGFWFKIAAGPSFPAKRDFPSDHILAVGRKPEVRQWRIEGFVTLKKY